VEFRRCLPLDMILAPDPAFDEAASGLLPGRWSDLAVSDLPPAAQTVALAENPSWRTIATALTEPDAVDYACAAFVGGIRRELSRRFGTERDAVISLARAGLTSDTVSTLDELGKDWGVTRERIRQLAHDVHNEAKLALPPLAPLRLVFGAHILLHPRIPITIDLFASHDSMRARILKLALDVIGLPQPSAPFLLWTETAAQCRAVNALLGALPEMFSTANSYADLAARASEILPRIDETLDLASTLPLLVEKLDFGPGLDGRFAGRHTALVKRVADKIVTYLQRRGGVPIPPADLARAVKRGVPPFEPFHRPPIQADWLIGCARRSSAHLQLFADGSIGLARGLAHLRPSGNLGVLHSIVVEHGEPMRMMDLCDQAARYGISRNQVGVFIHSGRAACLFMLNRGIVGLVGRDEGADPDDYTAATPRARSRPRIGQEIGFDAAGCVAVDLEVRRSIREQGLALPWPFNLVYFSERPRLQVDGCDEVIAIRPNGDLDLPQLEPRSRVRLRLRTTDGGHHLSVETGAVDRFAATTNGYAGADIAPGLPTNGDRPGWVDVVLDQLGTAVHPLHNVQYLLPNALTPKRRLRALYAFVALGYVRPRGAQWRVHANRQLPDKLAEVFAILQDDPLAYAALTREQQAAAGWLVRATWLIPDVGWTGVRVNDLGDLGAEDEDGTDGARATTNPRESALMRIVEAAHQASDLLKHPGDIDGLEATRSIVRRYLTALGYTAYNAVRDVDGLGLDAVSVHRSTGDDASQLWLLLPVGAGITDRNVRSARDVARTKRIGLTVVTDAFTLVAIKDKHLTTIDLRTVGQHQDEFDRIIALAADPATLSASE
jgi:hypothetical protein